MATRRMGHRLVSRHPDRLLANPAVHILTDPAVQRTVCHPAADPAARNSFPPLHPGLRRSMPDLERPPRLCLLGMEVTGHESAFPDPHALSACLHHPVRHLCKTIPARTTYLPLPLGRSEDRRQVAQTRTGDKRVLPCLRHRPLYAEPRLESSPASRNHRDLPIHRFLFRLRNLLRKLQFHLSGCPNPHP